MMGTEKKTPLYVQVAQQLIEQLKAGTAPWQKPWSSDGLPAFQLPYNATTGNRYKGINTFSLLLRGYEDPRWVTFNQASASGWKVKKNEKGTLVQFVKTRDLATKRDGQGKPVMDGSGKPVKEEQQLSRPIVTYARVFNAAQVQGIPALATHTGHDKALSWDPLERAEALAKATGANIEHRPGDRAYYSLLADHIVMPLKSQFDAPDKYYATLIHELGHWTGHPQRLDRSLMNRRGSEAYAREELRAEISSMLLGQELRIGHDPGQHAAYVDSWIRVLTDTPFEIHSAAADAEKIMAYLLEMERKLDISLSPAAELPATPNPRSLTMGEQIAYKDTTFKVLSTLKQGRFRMEDLGTGQSFVLSKSDGLYASLLHARQQPENRPLSITADVIAQPGQTESRGSYGAKR